MPHLEIAYLGVGANLGDKVQSIIDAKRCLDSQDYCLQLTTSALYWSSPVGAGDQPAFVNCVFELVVEAPVEALFSDMQAIELQLGRTRDPNKQNEPRVLDLDLLIFGSQTIRLPGLEVPHPRLWQRRFVLEPLLELNEEIEIDGESVADKYRRSLEQGAFGDQEIYRLGKKINGTVFSNS